LQRGDTLLLQMEVPFGESLAAAQAARQAGARTLLSLAPYMAVATEDVEPFDVLIVNEHETADLAGHLGLPTGDAAQTAAALAGRLGRTVIATLGAAGAIAAVGDGVIRVPALAVTPVDTTGAGDVFSGVLAALLDEGADLQTAMARAAVAGSLACMKAGAQPSFPTRAEIEAAVGG
jgi:ribokinase